MAIIQPHSVLGFAVTLGISYSPERTKAAAFELMNAGLRGRRGSTQIYFLSRHAPTRPSIKFAWHAHAIGQYIVENIQQLIP
jgi:hypothetical protein